MHILIDLGLIVASVLMGLFLGFQLGTCTRWFKPYFEERENRGQRSVEYEAAYTKFI